MKKNNKTRQVIIDVSRDNEIECFTKVEVQSKLELDEVKEILIATLIYIETLTTTSARKSISDIMDKFYKIYDKTKDNPEALNKLEMGVL